MRIGLVGKNNTKGLGSLTRSFVQNVSISKLLIVKDQHTFPLSFRYAVEVEVDGVAAALDSFLKDLDLVIFLETFYKTGLQLCRTRKIRSILVVNYEYLPDIVSPLPDLFLCSSSLNFENTPYKNKILLPLPIDDQKFLFSRRSGIPSVLYHQCGSDGLFGYNGTHLLLEALTLLDENFELIIHQPPTLSQGAIPLKTTDSRVTILESSSCLSEYQLYSPAYDALICLQSIRATSLPIQEAMTCGLPVITTNTPPFDELVGVPELLVPVSHYIESKKTDYFVDQVGLIYTCKGKTYLNPKVRSAEVEVADVARTIKHFLSQPCIARFSEAMKSKAQTFSWNFLKEKYEETFRSVVGKRWGASLVKLDLNLKNVTSFDVPSYRSLYHTTDGSTKLHLVLTVRKPYETNLDTEKEKEKENIFEGQFKPTETHVLSSKIRRRHVEIENKSQGSSWENYMIEVADADYPEVVESNVAFDLKSLEIVSLPVCEDYIVYVGNFDLVSFSTENHVAKSLEDLPFGLGVLRLQENKVTTWDIQRWVSLLSKRPILFLYTRTWKIEGNVWELWKWLKEKNIPTVSFHLDLYVGLARETSIIHDPFWHTDYVFTADGNPRSQQLFRELGINHFYLKPGVLADECYLSNTVVDEPLEVIFVGTTDYHEEWPYRRELIKFLSKTFGRRFRTFGGSSETIRGHRLNTVYANAKIVVGDSLCPHFQHSHYWSDRVYETLGRGGFLIHPYIPGMEKEFRNHEHLVYYQYGDFNQLRLLIQYYLLQTEKREKVRRAGQEWVKTKCTYKHRMQTLFETVFSRTNFFLDKDKPLVPAKIFSNLSLVNCSPEFVDNTSFLGQRIGSVVVHGDQVLLYNSVVDGWLRVNDTKTVLLTEASQRNDLVLTLTKDKNQATTFILHRSTSIKADEKAQSSVPNPLSSLSANANLIQEPASVLDPLSLSSNLNLLRDIKHSPILIHDLIHIYSPQHHAYLSSQELPLSKLTHQGSVHLRDQPTYNTAWKVVRDPKFQLEIENIHFWYGSEKIALLNLASDSVLHSHFFAYPNGEFEVTCFGHDSVEWTIEKR
jgi:glycosyltransferase involved in cell wall biosynthesis